VWFAGGADGDLDVLAEGGEELHEAADAEVSGTIAHEEGDLGLLDAEDFGDFDLGQAAVLEDGIDLQGELGFEELLFGIGEAEIGEDVAAALGDASDALLGLFYFGFHFSFAFRDGRYISIHIFL